MTNKEKYIAAVKELIQEYRDHTHNATSCPMCRIQVCSACPLWRSILSVCTDLPYYQFYNEDVELGDKRIELHEFALTLYKDLPDDFFTEKACKKQKNKIWNKLYSFRAKEDNL